MTRDIVKALVESEESIRSGNAERMQWARARLSGLLDLEARKDARTEQRVRAAMRRISEALNG